MLQLAATMPLWNRARRVRDDPAAEADQAAGRMAHDLNNVLQIISGNLAMLSKHADDKTLSRTYIDRAMAGVDLGARLVGGLQGDHNLSAPVDLTTATEHIETLLADAVGADVDLRVKMPTTLRKVRVDLAELKNALLNLTLNARDAMSGRGALTITFRNVLRLSGPTVEITVTDTGCGMTPRVLARAMEPFFSTKGRRGSGLGLASVNRFVQRAGGSLAIHSAPGLGTTITLRLAAA